MEKLPMCRVCLAEDVRMYIVVNKNLRELYEKLTDNPFITEDSRPMLACFFCCTKLKQCWRFQRNCLKAEELFAQMMNEDYEPNPLRNQGYPEFCNGFIQSAMVHVSIDGECETESVPNPSSDAIIIKEELPAVCDRQDDVTEPEEENHSDELEKEIKANSFSDVEDIPAQHSESDSEGDVPLIQLKKEVEEEQETSREKRRAGDSQRAPATKKPKLRPRRSTVEDVITEEQTEQEQSETTVIQNPLNCALTTVTKCKEPLAYTATKLTDSSLDTNGPNSRKNEGSDSNKGTRLCFQEKPFKCDVCQRCFSQKSYLKKHSRTHTGEKPFKCDVCQRCFSQKCSLTRHIRTHTGENPFKCDICQRCFNDKCHLSRHIRTHTGGKPYKCDICQRCFKQKRYLTNHIRTHIRKKPFKCDVCQRCFSEKASLIIHFRIHTGEKPYKCEVCHRSFNHKGNLTTHIRTHTREKPFKCDVCQRCFGHKCTLSRHICTHTGENSFKCDVCHRCFSEKRSLIKHIRTHTGKNLTNTY